jgi:hypothetical protein
MPKIGDVLYVRTTSEPVLFVSERPQDADDNFPSHQGSHQVYIVRRPCPATAGIQTYKFFDFLQEELETAKESQAREVHSLKLRQDLLMAEMAGEAPMDLGQKPS